MKAFEFAADASKQAIALSIGILVFTITFFKDFIGQASAGAKVVVGLAWFLYFVSVVGGILNLQMLAGTIGHARPGESPSIYDSNVRKLALVQFAPFMLALLLTLIFGVVALVSGGFTNQVPTPTPSSSAPHPP